MAAVPPAPLNSQLAYPWTDPSSAAAQAATVGRGRDDKTKFIDPGEFMRKGRRRRHETELGMQK